MQNIITKVEDLRDKFRSHHAMEENAYQRACDDIIELIQLLQQTQCTTQLLPPDKIWLLKEIAHSYIYETAEEGTYSIATQGIEKILESYERLRQQLS